MTVEPNDSPNTGITRRQFVKTATAAAGLMITTPTWAQENAPQTAPASQAGQTEEFAVGLIGTGSQGQELMKFCLKHLVPQVRFVAVCDIWPYWRNYAAKLLDRYEQPVNAYEDYREMLDKEKHLDAVIVATCTAKRRCPTRSRVPGKWSSPPARPASYFRSATNAAASRATGTP